MVDIQSKEVIDKISSDLKIQPSLEIPRKLSNEIQLVYDVQPLFNANKQFGAQRTTTGTTTLTTTSSIKDFFLTGAVLSNQSDATADNTSAFVTCTPKGDGARTFLILSKLTTTAFSESITYALVKPLILERNSLISFTSTFTVGASSTAAAITGFETDPQ